MNPPSALKAAFAAILLHLGVLLVGALSLHGWLDVKTAATVTAWLSANIASIAEWAFAALTLYGSFIYAKGQHLLAAEYKKLIASTSLTPAPEIAKAIAQTGGTTVQQAAKTAIVLICAASMGCAGVTFASALTKLQKWQTGANILWTYVGNGVNVADQILTSSTFANLAQAAGLDAATIADIEKWAGITDTGIKITSSLVSSLDQKNAAAPAP